MVFEHMVLLLLLLVTLRRGCMPYQVFDTTTANTLMPRQKPLDLLM